ncbi:MAG: hydroxymyristoyl-ACP dehydratase [Planctomycetes bacterium]|nr:hydroxymyristoyl-ACP dehydratase [Planctomycetota bacterium]
MRFHLIDRILDLEPGKRIRMVKHLTLGEEYLADHFPTFPVMPGVLMLQTLVEGSAWLLRATEDFRHSVIVLRDARNVKYGTFMQPGNSMTITVEAAEYSPDTPTAVFKGKAELQGATTVAAKFTVARYNLRDRNPALKDADDRIVAQLRSHYRILRGEFDVRA